MVIRNNGYCVGLGDYRFIEGRIEDWWEHTLSMLERQYDTEKRDSRAGDVGELGVGSRSESVLLGIRGLGAGERVVYYRLSVIGIGVGNACDRGIVVVNWCR